MKMQPELKVQQAYKDMHNPPTGSVIGKAIENKDNDGPGVIEVLVGRL